MARRGCPKARIEGDAKGPVEVRASAPCGAQPARALAEAETFRHGGILPCVLRRFERGA